MDVEGTINFILEAQANAEVRMQKTDKQLDAITKLLQQGMRIVVKNNSGLANLRKEFAAAQKRTDARLAELAQAQRATEKSLKALIDSMRGGRNGH